MFDFFFSPFTSLSNFSTVTPFWPLRFFIEENKFSRAAFFFSIFSAGISYLESSFLDFLSFLGVVEAGSFLGSSFFYFFSTEEDFFWSGDLDLD